MKKRSFFSKIWGSLLFTFILPCVIIGVYFNLTAMRSAQQQLIHATETSLSQSAQTFNLILEQSLYSAYLLADDANFVNFLQDPGSPHTISTIDNLGRLSSLCYSGVYTSSVYAYSKAADALYVAGATSYSTGFAGFDDSGWMSAYQNRDSDMFLTGVRKSYPSPVATKVRHVFSALIKVPVLGLRDSGVIVINFDGDRLLDAVFADFTDTAEYVAVLDRDRNIVISNNRSDLEGILSSLDAGQHEKLFSGDSSDQIIDIDGHKLLLSAVSNPKARWTGDWRYISLTDYSGISGNMALAQNVTLLALAALVGVFVTWLFVRRLYRPIEDTVNASVKAVPESGGSEFEIISSTIHYLSSNSAQLSEKLAQNYQLLRERFLISLLSGKSVCSEEELFANLDYYRLPSAARWR